MDQLIQLVEEIPDELQNVREEIISFENNGVGGGSSTDMCQDMLDGLFKKVYEAINMVQGQRMGAQSKEEERLVQRLEEMPDELQNIREELATFENGATAGSFDKCQDILHGLFKRVYEAIDIVKEMGGQSKEEEPDVVVIEDGDISGPMSTPAHPSNRQNKQTEDGVVANPRFRDPLEKFPKLRDIQIQSKEEYPEVMIIDEVGIPEPKPTSAPRSTSNLSIKETENKLSNQSQIVNPMLRDRDPFEKFPMSEPRRYPSVQLPTASTAAQSRSRIRNVAAKKTATHNYYGGLLNNDFEFPKAKDCTRDGIFHGVLIHRKIQVSQIKRGKKIDEFIDEYECLCRVKCTGHKMMQVHYFEATQPRNFKCPNCFQGFRLRADLQQHCRQAYKHEIFPCEICCINYFTKVDYNFHTQTTDTECGRILKSAKFLYPRINQMNLQAGKHALAALMKY